MLFINLWNLARCDVVKGGFQLRAAKKGQAAPLERIPSDGCQGRLGGDGESQRCFLCQPWCSLSLLALLQLLSFSRLSTHLVIQQMFTESLLCARNQVGLEKGQWQNRPHFSCHGVVSLRTGVSMCPPQYHPLYACVPVWRFDASWEGSSACWTHSWRLANDTITEEQEMWLWATTSQSEEQSPDKRRCLFKGICRSFPRPSVCLYGVVDWFDVESQNEPRNRKMTWMKEKNFLPANSSGALVAALGVTKCCRKVGADSRGAGEGHLVLFGTKSLELFWNYSKIFKKRLK